MRIWIVFCLLTLFPCLVSAEEIYTDYDLERYSSGREMNYVDQTPANLNSVDRSAHPKAATARDYADKVKPIDRSAYSTAATNRDAAEGRGNKVNEPVYGGRGGCRIISTSTSSAG